jgi:G3E family GTPase
MDIILLTGFLGSGKTTLLSGLLNEYRDEKIGVIVNDFGKVNIDARLVETPGIKMAELSNGSIFCACIKDRFVDSLVEMAGRELSYLFIEASGLADPSNMGTILDGIAGITGGRLNLRGSVCIVDGETFSELSQVLPALPRQVEQAAVILLNKRDLIDDDTALAIREALNSLNPRADIVETSYCRADIRALVEGMKKTDAPRSDSVNTYESRPVTLILGADEPLSRDELEAFLRRLAPATYRIKGFAVTTAGGLQISYAGHQLTIAESALAQKTEIVAISAVGISLVSRVTAASAGLTDGRIRIVSN